MKSGRLKNLGDVEDKHILRKENNPTPRSFAEFTLSEA